MNQSRTVSAALSIAIAAGGAFAITAPHAFADFTSTSNVTNNTAAAGRLQVQIVDATGTELTAPIMTVSGAMPAMTAKTSTVRFKNSGSLPAQVRLHSQNVTSATAGNLDNVLNARVLEGTTVLYTGTLSGLTHTFASVAAGSTTTLTLEITWPDLPTVDDNPYQDASLSFELVADASSIAA